MNYKFSVRSTVIGTLWTPPRKSFFQVLQVLASVLFLQVMLDMTFPELTCLTPMFGKNTLFNLQSNYHPAIILLMQITICNYFVCLVFFLFYQNKNSIKSKISQYCVNYSSTSLIQYLVHTGHNKYLFARLTEDAITLYSILIWCFTKGKIQ